MLVFILSKMLKCAHAHVFKNVYNVRDKLTHTWVDIGHIFYIEHGVFWGFPINPFLIISVKWYTSIKHKIKHSV